MEIFKADEEEDWEDEDEEEDWEDEEDEEQSCIFILLILIF